MLTNEISSSFQTNYIKDIPWTSLIENAAKIQNDINSIQNLLEQQEDQDSNKSVESTGYIVPALTEEEHERLEHYLVEFLAPAIDDLDQRVDALADETKDAPSIPSLANAMEKLLDLLEADIELVSNSALPASVNPDQPEIEDSRDSDKGVIDFVENVNDEDVVPLPNDPNQTHQLTSASTSVAVDSDKHFNNDNNRVEEDEQQRDMSVEATPPINETVVEEKCPPSPTLESFGISEFSKVLLATGEDGYIDSGVVGRRFTNLNLPPPNSPHFSTPPSITKRVSEVSLDSPIAPVLRPVVGDSIFSPLIRQVTDSEYLELAPFLRNQLPIESLNDIIIEFNDAITDKRFLRDDPTISELENVEMETLAGVEKKLLKPAMIACLQLKRLQLGKEMTPGVKTYFVL